MPGKARVSGGKPTSGKCERYYSGETENKSKLLAELVNVQRSSIFGSDKKTTVTCNEIPGIIWKSYYDVEKIPISTILYTTVEANKSTLPIFILNTLLADFWETSTSDWNCLLIIKQWFWNWASAMGQKSTSEAYRHMKMTCTMLNSDGNFSWTYANEKEAKLKQQTDAFGEFNTKTTSVRTIVQSYYRIGR